MYLGLRYVLGAVQGVLPRGTMTAVESRGFPATGRATQRDRSQRRTAADMREWEDEDVVGSVRVRRTSPNHSDLP
jgi:hypothetical protein